MATALKQMKKIVLVTNIPTPYRVPLFNTLSSKLRDAGVCLKVAFAAPTYARRKWQVDGDSFRFDATILSIRDRSRGRRKPVFFYPGLVRFLQSESPDVVIAAGFSMGTMKSWLWSRFSRAPLVIWSGSEPENRGALRRAYRSFLARGCEGAVCYGSRARTYMIDLGMPEDRTWLALNTVDVHFFRSRTKQLAGSDPTPRRFLYVGDLVRQKRVDLLLQAVDVLSRRRQDFIVEIVGTGPIEATLRRMVEEQGLRKFVRFEGYQPNDELPRYFAAASGFIFPTDKDIWGLVLIEAMAAGLPCVASIRAGATDDVVRHGENGWAADFHDPSSVADRLEWILEHPHEASEMGRRASDFISETLSLESCAEGFIKAITGVTDASATAVPDARPIERRNEVAYDLS